MVTGLAQRCSRNCKIPWVATPSKPPVLMRFSTHSQSLMIYKPLDNPDISYNLAKGQW